MSDEDWEVLVQVYRVTERRGGAIYRTEYVGERWVPMAERWKHGPDDEVYASLPTSDERPMSQTMRRRRAESGETP